MNSITNVNLHIKRVINKLNKIDCDKDYLLIELLKEKLSDNEYLEKNFYSKQDYHNGLVVVTKIIRDEIDDYEYGKIHKAENIIKCNDCEHCKYSIPKTHIFNGESFDYKTHDNTDRCDRCFYQIDKLYDYIKNKKRDIEKQIQSIINDKNTKSVIGCKIMISKVRKRLNTLKTKNNDAS